MDKLPPELLHAILLQIPTSFLPECRLVCRPFSTLAFPLLFSHIPRWLDYEASHRAIIALAHDAYNRPAVMWSPWASEPDKPVDQIWLEICWRLLMKGDLPGTLTTTAGVSGQASAALKEDQKERIGEEEGGEIDGGKETVLSSKNFAELSGREEMTENRLRTGQNRFLLHKAYASKAGGVF